MINLNLILPRLWLFYKINTPSKKIESDWPSRKISILVLFFDKTLNSTLNVKDFQVYLRQSMHDKLKSNPTEIMAILQDKNTI